MKSQWKKSLSAALIALSSLALTDAIAQQSTVKKAAADGAWQQVGPYIGASIGSTDFDACGGAPAGASCDDKDTGWKIVGGYKFSTSLSAEVGYIDMGEVVASAGGLTADIGVTTFYFAGLAAWPLGDSGFSIFGKLGFHLWDVDAGAFGSDDGTDLMWGLGMQYDLSKNLGLRVEYEAFDDADVNLLSVGFIYSF